MNPLFSHMVAIGIARLGWLLVFGSPDIEQLLSYAATGSHMWASADSHPSLAIPIATIWLKGASAKICWWW